MKLNQQTWPAYAKAVAYPGEPEEYLPAAVERLMVDIKDLVIDVKNVRPQFKALNSIQMIHFRNAQEADFYNKAWERYQAEKAKIEAKMDEGRGMGGQNSRMQILAQFTKFRQAAELIRAEHLADSMYDCVQNHNKAAICAMEFKASIAKCVKILHDKYGVSRDLISLIWGGGESAVSKEKKKKIALKKKIESNADMLKFLTEELDMDMYDLGLGTTDVNEAESAKPKVVLDDTLRLGPQSKKERQKEIDRFQAGKSLYCFFTFKSGGVGLSLHHSDELTKEKCRRKPDSNFAFEEDIPKIPTRQRICFLTPPYSAMELVQGLGRCPRLTSLSHTSQAILFYKGTIEERVAWIVSAKLRCLKKVVQQKESWEDVVLGGLSTSDKEHSKQAEQVKQLLDQIPEGKPIEDETDDGSGELDIDDEEEEGEE